MRTTDAKLGYTHIAATFGSGELLLEVVDRLGEAGHRAGGIGCFEGGEVDSVEQEFVYLLIIVLVEMLVEYFFYGCVNCSIVFAYFAGADNLGVFVFEWCVCHSCKMFS